MTRWILLLSLLICTQAFGEEAQLYSYWRSSCSWRVRIALHLKQIPFDYIAYESIPSTEEYLRLNPMGKIPTLCIDGKVLSQSMAIIEYLEETRPEPSLLPEDPFQRSQTRQIAQMIASDIQPLQNGAVLKLFSEEEALAWAKHWIHKGLAGVEQVLKETAGQYSVGDHITIADLFLVPQVWNAKRYGVELDAFPIMQRICQNLESHPSFEAARPELQPDSK